MSELQMYQKQLTKLENRVGNEGRNAQVVSVTRLFSKLVTQSLLKSPDLLTAGAYSPGISIVEATRLVNLAVKFGFYDHKTHEISHMTSCLNNEDGIFKNFQKTLKELIELFGDKLASDQQCLAALRVITKIAFDRMADADCIYYAVDQGISDVHDLSHIHRQIDAASKTSMNYRDQVKW